MEAEEQQLPSEIVERDDLPTVSIISFYIPLHWSIKMVRKHSPLVTLHWLELLSHYFVVSIFTVGGTFVFGAGYYGSPVVLWARIAERDPAGSTEFALS